MRGPPSDRKHHDVKQRDKPVVKEGEEAGGDKGPSASDRPVPASRARDSDDGSRSSSRDSDVADSTGTGVGGGGAGAGKGGEGGGGQEARGPVARDGGKEYKESEAPDLALVGAKLRKEFVPHGVFEGVIQEARYVPNEQGGGVTAYFRVLYDDGDEEDLKESQVRSLLTSVPSSAPKAGPKAHHDPTSPGSAAVALAARSLERGRNAGKGKAESEGSVKGKGESEGSVQGLSGDRDGGNAETNTARVTAAALRWQGKGKDVGKSGDVKKDRETELWTSKFERLKQFQIKHGHVQVKKTSPENQDLYWWIKVCVRV